LIVDCYSYPWGEPSQIVCDEKSPWEEVMEMYTLVNRKSHFFVILGVSLVLVMAFLLSFSKIAGASTIGPTPDTYPTNDFTARCLSTTTTDVWDTVSDISPSDAFEYTAEFNTPSGITTDMWSAYPYGITNSLGVATVPPGSYVFSGTITDNFGDTYIIPPTLVEVPSCSGPSAPYVGIATTPSVQGYWGVTAAGNVFNVGYTNWFGDLSDTTLNKPIVGMAATPDGNGYWLVASDGGVFSFGDAQFYGSTGGIHLNKPIVGMAKYGPAGYWFIGADGNVYSYGTAENLGGPPMSTS
jgi:hypothetical protein